MSPSQTLCGIRALPEPENPEERSEGHARTRVTNQFRTCGCPSLAPGILDTVKLWCTGGPLGQVPDVR